MKKKSLGNGKWLEITMSIYLKLLGFAVPGTLLLPKIGKIQNSRHLGGGPWWNACGLVGPWFIMVSTVVRDCSVNGAADGMVPSWYVRRPIKKRAGVFKRHRQNGEQAFFLKFPILPGSLSLFAPWNFTIPQGSRIVRLPVLSFFRGYFLAEKNSQPSSAPREASIRGRNGCRKVLPKREKRLLGRWAPRTCFFWVVRTSPPFRSQRKGHWKGNNYH